jgi:putative transposase
MPNYIRAHIPGGTFFLTLALLDRRERLPVEHVDLLRASFASVRLQRPFLIEAIVILPDHLNCICA